MAKPEGTQKVQIVQPPGREDRIRETALKLFASLASRDEAPADTATRAIEGAIAFEDAWRAAKDSGQLEGSTPDDVFTV